MPRKKILLFTITALIILLLAAATSRLFDIRQSCQNQPVAQKALRTIQDTVTKGDTLFAIFTKHGLCMDDLYAIKDAAAHLYPLKNINTGHPYRAEIDSRDRINRFVYQINRDSVLEIRKNDDGFEAVKKDIPYEKRLLVLTGNIVDNLVSSLGNDHEHLLLALQLSDIFAWNIDFSVDLQKNDSYRIIAEGLYLDGAFKRYGDIIAAEFVNNGETFKAYRFGHDGNEDYYDENGKSLRRAFLKAPLNFRRISSCFSEGRLHPILKIRRPHNGIDYVAAAGTPVSAIGDGKVIFAGWRGQYGKLIILRHPNGWKTYYGHLSIIFPRIKNGVSVKQGEVIGNVGSTGLATGPHLHYEFRINDQPVDPLKVKIPEGWTIPTTQMAAFQNFRGQMDTCFSNPRDLHKYADKSEKSERASEPLL